MLLLKSQPDIGMLAVVTAVFFAQLYVAGLNLAFVGVGVARPVRRGGRRLRAVPARAEPRAALPRSRRRATTTRSTTALEAFGNGGLLGRGPGEGHVKDVLPDAHADFVFAVAGEEFGMIVCLVIARRCSPSSCCAACCGCCKEHDLFVVLASTGLVAGFGLQAFVNMASTLHLIPTKGMTLPFISYGGSSVLAVALGIGHAAGADPAAPSTATCREGPGGADPSSSPPAAPADISSRPRRWRRSWSRAASASR